MSCHRGYLIVWICFQCFHVLTSDVARLIQRRVEIRNVRTIGFCRKDSCCRWRTRTFWCVSIFVWCDPWSRLLRCGNGSWEHTHHLAAVCESVSIASKLKLEKARSAFNFNTFLWLSNVEHAFCFYQVLLCEAGCMSNLIKVIQRWAAFTLTIVF